MDWRAWRIVAGIACVVLASAACAGPLIVVDLPTGGALGDASASAVRTLESNGYEVVRLGIDDFDLASADIAALCFGSSSELRRQIGGDIAAAGSSTWPARRAGRLATTASSWPGWS